MKEFGFKLLDRIMYHPLPWMRPKPDCLCYRCDPELFRYIKWVWAQPKGQPWRLSKGMRRLILISAIVNSVLFAWNIATAARLRQWPWSLVNVGVAGFCGAIAVLQFQ